jgi:hypothetical protein
MGIRRNGHKPAENEAAIFSICHIWSRDVIDDVPRCSTINAVPRQSFVIHPNGGWWQSTLNPKTIGSSQISTCIKEFGVAFCCSFASFFQFEVMDI